MFMLPTTGFCCAVESERQVTVQDIESHTRVPYMFRILTLGRARYCAGKGRCVPPPPALSFLLLLGRQGLRRVGSLILGSVSTKVLQHAKCNVVVIR